LDFAILHKIKNCTLVGWGRDDSGRGASGLASKSIPFGCVSTEKIKNVLGEIWRRATEGNFSKTDVEHCLECLEVGLVNGSEIKAGHAKEPRTKVKAPLISPSLGALTPGPKVHKPIGVKLTTPNFYTKTLRCLKSSNLCFDHRNRPKHKT